MTTTAITETQSIQTGYVIVRPTDDVRGGLVVSANLLLTVGSQMPQGVFTATPLVNAAALPVIDNEAMLQNTGLAIVNPHTQAVDIMLVLRQTGVGGVPLSRNFTLGAGQQSAQFVNQTSL